jgi:AAA+ superfamily predicted ATPase
MHGSPDTPIDGPIIKVYKYISIKTIKTFERCFLVDNKMFLSFAFRIIDVWVHKENGNAEFTR